MRAEILWRFESNLARARNLTDIYTQVARPGQGRQPVATIDVLRAATVFLHASLEEVMRNIARWKFPESDEVVLNEVPIIGTRGRAEKFYLGKLVNYRTKTVQELITESVESYLNNFTINNVPELTNFLVKLGVPVDEVNAEFPNLAQLFERRHHIVHQADRNDEPGQGNHGARGLNNWTVMEWMNSVEIFIRDLLPRIPD